LVAAVVGFKVAPDRIEDYLGVFDFEVLVAGGTGGGSDRGGLSGSGDGGVRRGFGQGSCAEMQNESGGGFDSEEKPELSLKRPRGWTSGEKTIEE